MGNELYITRKENWFDEDGDAISLTDWLSYVGGDPEMRADGAAEVVAPDGSTVRIEDRGIAVWTAYSGHSEDGKKAWFTHRAGVVSVKNPDIEIRRKMFLIASALEGVVQGEEGEHYGADGEASEETSDSDGTKRSKRRPWWKLWR